jgi:hypothetical protein
MGEGEEYLERWRVWLDGVSAVEFEAYEREFPEPEEWRGFYAFEWRQRNPRLPPA